VGKVEEKLNYLNFANKAINIYIYIIFKRGGSKSFRGRENGTRIKDCLSRLYFMQEPVKRFPASSLPRLPKINLKARKDCLSGKTFHRLADVDSRFSAHQNGVHQTTRRIAMTTN
jgi:hypothetical protein